MQSETVTRWIDAYIDAWRSNDPESIAALFAEDATYAYHPWDEPLRGREAIVADWLK
ncbi:MAG: SgcJ/EcaC family oxidoreductase, partial [Acidimicrobiia bacterium]|nr:SgcJ/EcaC family oxidoreductase [Acidimicrobiia bacterium]